MKKERFDLHLDKEDIEELIRQAEKQQIAPRALARIFIRNGLTEYSPERLKLMDSVDDIQTATTAIREMLVASLFLASRAQVVNLPKQVGESDSAYVARLGAESLRLIDAAMSNTAKIQSHLDRK